MTTNTKPRLERFGEAVGVQGGVRESSSNSEDGSVTEVNGGVQDV